MPTIELGAEEARVVRELLDRELKELIHEISKTDHRPLREELKRRATTLEGALAKLGAPPPPE